VRKINGFLKGSLIVFKNRHFNIELEKKNSFYFDFKRASGPIKGVRAYIITSKREELKSPIAGL